MSNNPNDEGEATDRTMPSIKAFFTNMSAPLPMSKKLYLVFRNNLTKLVKRQSCCGHSGEPGC